MVFLHMKPTNHISKNASIVILTGAGISAESGLETFRGAGGLWCGHRVEEVATPQAFACNPALVHEFYNMRRRGLLDPSIKPNAGHFALAKLEQQWQGDVLVVTQNIDNLHERAGTKNLIHMHGEALKAFCHYCGYNIPCEDDLSTTALCSNCKKTGGLRPDIVWFGEMPYHMDKIYEALINCDLFLSIGTSGNVYPAAGFVAEALRNGAYTLELNLEPSLTTSVFNQTIQGPAGQTLPAYVDKLLSQ
jgi:NAD-dependent deacetylase